MYKKGDLIYSLQNKTVERICKLADRFTDNFGVDNFYVLNVIGRDEPLQNWMPISESASYVVKPTILSIPVDYITRLVTPAEFDLYMDLIGSWNENLLEPVKQEDVFAEEYKNVRDKIEKLKTSLSDIDNESNDDNSKS